MSSLLFPLPGFDQMFKAGSAEPTTINNPHLVFATSLQTSYQNATYVAEGHISRDFSKDLSDCM